MVDVPRSSMTFQRNRRFPLSIHWCLSKVRFLEKSRMITGHLLENTIDVLCYSEIYDNVIFFPLPWNFERFLWSEIEHVICILRWQSFWKDRCMCSWKELSVFLVIIVWIPFSQNRFYFDRSSPSARQDVISLLSMLFNRWCRLSSLPLFILPGLFNIAKDFFSF